MQDEYRKQRIERLLEELQYEVTRGMMNKEVGEEITYRFIVPVSSRQPGGVVLCEFKTTPMPCSYTGTYVPRLTIVK